MKRKGLLHLLMILLTGVFFSSCATDRSAYIENVFEFNLNSPGYGGLPPGFVRAQSIYILHGTLTAKEREEKLGQYYNLKWEDTTPDIPLDLVFECQRAGSGSRIHKQTIHYPAGRSGGEVDVPLEFTGKDYVKWGRVMTWKATLLQEGQEISRRTSYLWQDPR